MSHQVVSGLQAGRDRINISAVAGRHQGRVCPGTAGAVTPPLGNLEPHRVGVGHVVLAACHITLAPLAFVLVCRCLPYTTEKGSWEVHTRVRASRHVRDDGSDMAIRPERPVQRDGGAGGGVGVKLGWRGPDDSAVGPAAALKVLVGHVRNGAVALDGTRNPVGL